MGILPIPNQLDSVYTLGALAARVRRWVAEPLKDPAIIDDAINDALETVWMSSLLATLSKFTKGPVSQVIPANSNSIRVVSIPDPVTGPVVTSQAGGNLPARTEYWGYCYVTDSGSVTLVSPLTAIDVPANSVSVVAPPPQAEDAIGWYAWAATDAAGLTLGLQSVRPEIFTGLGFICPPVGVVPFPQSPAPPIENSTGDNIFAIERLETFNVNMTYTSWLQSNQASLAWTRFGKVMAGTATSWTPYAYDFIDNNQVQFRPAPGFDLNAQLLYVVRPRRLRFPNSRLPFTSIACQRFLAMQSLADCLLSLYEFEAHDRWNAKAEKELQAIILQVAQSNWNRDTTVTPFMRA